MSSTLVRRHAEQPLLCTYEGIAVCGGRFRNTEILTFRGGQIIDVEVKRPKDRRG